MDDNSINLDDIHVSNEYNKKSNEDYDVNYSEEMKKKQRDEQINVSISNEDGRDIRSLEIHNETDNDLQVVDKFTVPSNLKKTFIFSLVLAGMGLTLFILGFIQDVQAADPGKGITFWVLGGFVMIPGGYYSFQFWRARRTRDLDERDEILDNIPEL